MNVLDSARDRYLARFEEGAPERVGEPGWLAALRRAAIDAFAGQGLPSTRLEEWRYTNVKPLAGIPFEPARGAGGHVSGEQLERLALPLFACSLYVFADGQLEPALSATRAVAGDLPVESLARLLREAPGRLEPYLGRSVDPKQHPFAALNTAFARDGAVLVVPPGMLLERPLHLVFATTGSEAPVASHPRVLIVAGEGSQVTVIQDHVSLDAGPAHTNAVTEVCVEQGAAVRLVLLQRESGASFHTSNLQARLARDARFSAHTISLGGRLVRNDAGVLLGDEGAECTLHGLFLGAGRAVVDNHTLVDHAMPHGTSRELYKGILGGHSRGVFRGRVVVRPDAQRTLAQQSNPNLLVSDSAEIDTKPQLEIRADDVKCSHGASIGNLDENALFYLRSRAIGESHARDLLTRAFGAEILESLPVEALAQQLDGELLERLRGLRTPEEPA